jgi:phosphohistidine swiveling domain-containing protein
MAGSEVTPIYKGFEANVVLTTKSVQGVVAHKGFVKGVVRRVSVDYSNFERLAKEMENMEVGQILVAETTAPELIGAIRKAAAIVTDQGGLMSHAAIVSRELNIPCIVGTKVATQVLRDGDLVEVDANAGIIRVLKI